MVFYCTRRASGRRGPECSARMVHTHPLACYSLVGSFAALRLLLSGEHRWCFGTVVLDQVEVYLPGRPLRSSSKPYTTLYYTILYYAILSYPILSYPILSYTMLSYPILYWYYAILYYTMLCYPILSYTVLHCTILSYPILYCNPNTLPLPIIITVPVCLTAPAFT